MWRKRVRCIRRLVQRRRTKGPLVLIETGNNQKRGDVRKGDGKDEEEVVN